MQPMKRQVVYVGLSGGVDSAVSAALLQKAGYHVRGVYIRVWQPDWIECNWREERRDAMRVAAHLGIPFTTIDAEKEYKQGVIDYMIAEYAAGRTPNPDVMCNREVKFGVFWRWAKAHGADFIATGHYAQVKKGEAGFSLLMGIDPNKAQSYFLWTLNNDDLAHVLFPVGHITKLEVRKLAKKFRLPNADKKDSQGLCFIGKIDVKEFLGHYIKQKPGDVLDEKGRIIGKHNGALLLTIGERHGFTITEKTPNDLPYYVVGKDAGKNTVTAAVRGKGSSDKLFVTSLKSQKRHAPSLGVSISQTNWTNHIPNVGDTFSVRTRYRQPLINATLTELNVEAKTAVFKLDHTTDPTTPGQSLVVYLGDECFGGGIIN